MKKNTLTIWLLFAILLFAIVGSFAKIMTSLDHNEHMYIAASVLVAQDQVLYKDFAYLQTPYLPLLYGGFYRLLGVNSFYFLIGKLISFLFLIISSMILFLLSRRVLNDIALSLSIVALFLLNMSIVNPATEVSNYIMPVAFSMASFFVFNVSIENQIKPFGVALAGFFLAIAIGIKLTYATVVIPFTVTTFYLLNENSAITAKKIITYVLCPFIAGIAIGLLPMSFFLLDFETFLFNNLGYHNVNVHWRQITGYPGPMSLFSKLNYARKLFFQADNLILILGILLGFGFSINNAQTVRQTAQRAPKGAFLAFLLVVIAVATALAPTPSFRQYYAMPVSFLFLLLVYSLRSESVEISTLYKRLLLILVSISLAYNGLSLLNSMSNLTHRDKWSSLYIHDVSMTIRNVLIEKTGDTNHKIATLSPLFVIESNLPIYSELSTGPFLFRVGDLLTPEERNHFVGTSSQSIDVLFHKDPPAAILVGFEGKLDKSLIKYAITNDYIKVDVAGFDGELYVRP